MRLQKRLYTLLAVLVAVFMAGSLGYWVLFYEEAGFLECMYMTVISLTSVGYGEVLPVTGNKVAEIYTMVLIIFGMGMILYAISTLTAIIIEGDLSGLLRKRQMEREIAKQVNHIIVCGGGETGYPVLQELIKNNERPVLVESDETRIERCATLGDILYIKGDATDDENLAAAGIERAAGLIATLPSDKDNLYVTMTARMMNRKIRIISRMIEPKLEPKLRKAGANRVVSPNFIGALRMASEMIRPAAVDFLDKMLRSKKGNIRIHQLIVSKGSRFAGKKILESGLKNEFGILVLGAKHGKDEIEFNPPPDQVLDEGMVLIVMGDVDDIAKVKEVF